ncbi:MAG: hypothetical protein ACRBBZ_07475 [Nitrosopumilus sp.]
MKHSIMLIGVVAVILGIGILGGLLLMDSDSIEKTVPMVEPDPLKQEKSAPNNAKCSPDAFGRIMCSP